MSPIVCRAMSEIDLEDFTTAFNQAYHDYLIPVTMTKTAFHNLMLRDDLIPEASVVAIDNETIVGTGLLGIRNESGWIGGMGVIPNYRRRGIGNQMMYYLLDRAREHHLTEIKLEVIENNHGAHTLYRQLGFVHTRYLLIVKRHPMPVTNLSQRYAIEERAVDTLLPYYTTFHARPNCWQCDLPSLEKLTPHLQGWAALDGLKTVGYALGWVSPQDMRLADMAADPASDQSAVGQALLTYLHQRHPDAYSLNYNIAADNPVLAAYNTLDYTTGFRQIEMQLSLQ